MVWCQNCNGAIYAFAMKPLGSQLTAALRRATAMLCMALAVMASFQSYIGVMDRMDHARHIVHFPNPLAGDAEYCNGALGLCNEDSSAHHDALMHHHGDAIPAPCFVVQLCAVVKPRYLSTLADFISETPLTPDRPPKRSAEFRI